MKAFLTIDIEISDYELTLSKARVWEKENKYRYSGDEIDALLTDYLMSDINAGYSIADITLYDEQNYLIKE
jgi:hypothetical protein